MTTYQLDAARIPCPVCGAPAGELCTTTLTEVPDNAARIHVTRAIRADYTR